MPAAGVEKADAPRGPDVFPRRWIERGVAPVGPTSEAALVGWIRANIAEDRARGIGGRFSRVPSGAPALRRLVDLLERRHSPC